MGNKQQQLSKSEIIDLSRNKELQFPVNLNISRLSGTKWNNVKKRALERGISHVCDIQFYEHINCFASLSSDGTSSYDVYHNEKHMPYDVMLWKYTKLENDRYEFSVVTQYMMGGGVLFLHHTLPAVIKFNSGQWEIWTIKPYKLSVSFPCYTGRKHPSGHYKRFSTIKQYGYWQHSLTDKHYKPNGFHWIFIIGFDGTVYVYMYKLDLLHRKENGYINYGSISLCDGNIKICDASAYSEDGRNKIVCLVRQYANEKQGVAEGYQVFVVENDDKLCSNSKLIWSVDKDQIPHENFIFFGRQCISPEGRYVAISGRTKAREKSNFNSILIYDIYKNEIMAQMDLNADVAYCRMDYVYNTNNCPCLLVNSVANFYWIVMDTKLYENVLLEFFHGIAEIVDIVLLYIECSVIEVKNDFSSRCGDTYDKVVFWNDRFVTNVRNSYSIKFFKIY